MEQEMVSPANRKLLIPSMPSSPFVLSDQQLSSPPFLTNGRDYLGLYSVFSPKEANTPIAGSTSVSLTPSSVSLDEYEYDHSAATENRLFLAGLSLQYQEIAQRYELSLSHLQDAAREAEALRQENARLRVANSELTTRLGLLSGGMNQASSYPAAALVEEFRRLGFRPNPSPPAVDSPTSVLGFQGSDERLGRRVGEKRVSLPKSISIRSSGYLKMKPSSSGGGGDGGDSGSNINGRIRVSSPAIVGSHQQRVVVGKGSKNGSPSESIGETDGGEEEAAVELEVYNQGMFKTELCNKWQETGDCPYGEHCQFAHGVAELRPVIRHPRYKTEVCRMVLAGDPCPYGHRCHFRHALTTHDFLLQRPL